MRVFIAIDLPKEIKDYLYDLQKEIISKIDTQDIKIRWVHKKNLHLSLKFMKEFPEDKLEFVKKTISEISFKPIKAILKDIGTYSSRVLYVEMQAPEIFNVQQEIDEKLSSILKKERKFTLHLTLGRVKWIKNQADLNKVIDKIKVEPKEFIMDKIKIFESKLTKEGPIYSEVK